MMFRKRDRESAPYFRRGDLVEVRSQREILATLDSEGKLEGLPFMPEMAKCCGRRFRVHRRAEKVFLDHHFYVAGMKGTVLLEAVRCDGALHGGCQMGCLFFWKEAWLKPVEEANGAEDTHVSGTGTVTLSPRESQDTPRLVMAQPHSADDGASCAPDGRLSCQATELIRATSPLPWWDVRQYARDLASGNMTLRDLARMVLLLARNKLRTTCGLRRYGTVSGRRGNASNGRLNLQPGEMVEVKSKEEIEATLDERGRTRGLGFAPEMLEFCGRRYRVANRVERIILEWSGQMRPISDTVILEGVTCHGAARRGCPRDCHQLWRESWLRRVT